MEKLIRFLVPRHYHWCLTKIEEQSTPEKEATRAIAATMMEWMKRENEAYRRINPLRLS